MPGPCEITLTRQDAKREYGVDLPQDISLTMEGVTLEKIRKVIELLGATMKSHSSDFERLQAVVTYSQYTRLNNIGLVFEDSVNPSSEN